MSTAASGRREVREGTDYIVLTRTFRAPIQDVWAAVTEPQRLERWIGTWTGDPESGEVTFRMTAEARTSSRRPTGSRCATRPVGCVPTP